MGEDTVTFILGEAEALGGHLDDLVEGVRGDGATSRFAKALDLAVENGLVEGGSRWVTKATRRVFLSTGTQHDGRRLADPASLSICP